MKNLRTRWQQTSHIAAGRVNPTKFFDKIDWIIEIANRAFLRNFMFYSQKKIKSPFGKWRLNNFNNQGRWGMLSFTLPAAMSYNFAIELEIINGIKDEKSKMKNQRFSMMKFLFRISTKYLIKSNTISCPRVM